MGRIWRSVPFLIVFAFLECPQKWKKWSTCIRKSIASTLITDIIAKKSGTKLTTIKHSADNRNDTGMTGDWDSRALVCSSRILRYIT